LAATLSSVPLYTCAAALSIPFSEATFISTTTTSNSSSACYTLCWGIWRWINRRQNFIPAWNLWRVYRQSDGSQIKFILASQLFPYIQLAANSMALFRQHPQDSTRKFCIMHFQSSAHLRPFVWQSVSRVTSAQKLPPPPHQTSSIGVCRTSNRHRYA
jgi:hypothetical protein